MDGQTRVIHLRAESDLSPKCGAADASTLSNWVRGASFPEIYVPAEMIGRADVVCRKCQEAALADDSGSDDDVVDDDDEQAQVLGDASDADLLAEIARRLGEESALAEEEGKKTEDDRR